tara:strand:- start:91 stop:990 length:900 start_codon:yes stop_codon:yes gene_type:complete
MLKKKLCIGTAQFGTDYGITNLVGRIQIEEVKEILKLMRKNDINLIDTARSYGDSEKIIGKIIDKNDDFFKIITKISPYFTKELSNRNQFNEWTKLFEDSLARLNKNMIEGILIHSNKINLNQRLILMDWLLELKNRGKVKKIGWSIYEEKDLESINLKNIDLVQLPFSFYDQRLMASGFLKKLYEEGIEVHARSIFLQGLILTNYSNWPKWVDSRDNELHKVMQKNISSIGSTPIEMAISYVKACPYVDALVFGFTSTRELLEIIKVFNNQSKFISTNNFCNINFSSKLLDPRLWPTN